MSANVVGSWRRRHEQQARQGWKCASCGKLYLVQRRACAGCGATAGFAPAPLPRRGTVAALTDAGASVEHLDQVTDRKATVLLDLPDGSRLACLLTAADAGPTMTNLRGASLRLVVRRLPLGQLPTDQPIPYVMKAATDLKTRLSLRKPPEGGNKAPDKEPR